MIGRKDEMESTPPPLPSTPPPIPSQPPRSNWWSRNWKWFVPTGCFTFVALGVAFVVCIFFLVFSVLKSTDVYKTAFARAKNDPRVTAVFGTPIHDGMFVSGNTRVSGGSGTAEFAIPISGPKDKGTIYVGATRSNGDWLFLKLLVKVNSTGETIDLNRAAESASASEEKVEDEETADERVESITLARENGDKLQPVKSFQRSDNPQHIVIILTDGVEGTHVKTVWTNLNAGGATNQKLWEKELVTDEKNHRADFSLSNSNSKIFPPGDYKIEVYLDDELIQTVKYRVQ